MQKQLQNGYATRTSCDALAKLEMVAEELGSPPAHFHNPSK